MKSLQSLNSITVQTGYKKLYIAAQVSHTYNSVAIKNDKSFANQYTVHFEMEKEKEEEIILH
jgi:hypothetical protein